ncbi:MAG: MBL fold metallo-hydrolase [Caulobacterales bacterium]|nr:MBL fold metallo-hydrolase [Caulobacterales bacterium]
MSRHLWLAGACAGLFAASAHAQGDFADVVIESADLGDGLYMLTGAGGNIGVSAGEDGVFMIDDQFAALTDRIAAKIAEITGEETGEVRFIVNTHYHFDHTGGNEDWSGRGATVFAHENVHTRLSTPQISPFTGEVSPPEPEGAWPVVTYPDAVTFRLNGETVRVRHMPGAHTDGDSVVYFEEANVVHMGDIFFNGAFPFIDVGAGGSIDGVIAAMETALGYIDEDTQVIPGHGPLTDKAGLSAAMELLQDIRGRVAPLAEAGQSVEDIVAANPLADLDEAYGQGFMKTDVFTGLVARSLGAVSAGGEE